MAVEYSGYAGPFYCFFLWLIWWGEAPERPSTYTRAKDIFDGERTRLGQTPCRAAVYGVDCVWNAWHLREIRLRLRRREDAEIRGAKSYPDGSARFLIYYRLHGVESLLALVRFLGPSGASPHHRMTPVIRPSRTTS
jgi:hypothetical protein